MRKKQVLRRICQLDKSAKPELLANFHIKKLCDYLRYLIEVNKKEMTTPDKALIGD